MTTTEKLWTIGEAAAYFNVTVRTLRTRVKSGDVQAVKFGRRVLSSIPDDLKKAATARQDGGAKA